VYPDDLDFIILFVGILSLYAINVDVVSLFVYSPFTFLAMLILMYSINLNIVVLKENKNLKRLKIYLTII